MTSTQIGVVGTGLAGLVCALALGRAGHSVVLIGPEPNGADTRTTALMSASLARLAALGIDVPGSALAAPLRHMEILDATARLMRARPMRFDAVEIGLDAFGWNIPNRDLARLLADAIAATPGVERIVTSALRAECGDDLVAIELAGGEIIRVRLAVGADGHASMLRSSAGIGERRVDYPQSAMALNLRPARPLGDTSVEYHTEYGPFTLVPLPDGRASLVWLMPRHDAQRRRGLDDDILAAEIERQSQSRYGRISIDGPRSVWPMARLMADRMADRRIALVGEAGHALPPIGAQGFNMTMGDVGGLVEAVGASEDPGAETVLAAYRSARRSDLMMRSGAVRLLNHSLLSDAIGIQAGRSIGGYLLERVGPLRRAVMRHGVAAAERA